MIYIPFIKKVIGICVSTKNNKVHDSFVVYVVSRCISQSRFRPITLFGLPPAERALETGLAESTLRRTAEAFEALGMVSLLRPTAKQREDHHRSLPVPMRQLIVDLKAEYPDFSLREIADICDVQFERRPSHNTVKQVLANGPPPSRTTRQYPLYADIPDPAERRLAVIRLHAQGWSVTSIGAYLGVARKTIYQILKRWVEEGVRGLEDKSHANTNRPPTVDLRSRSFGMGDRKHFRRVKEPRHFETPYQSPQQPLWEPGAVEWHPAQRLPDYAPRRFHRHQTSYVQPPLLNDEQAGHGYRLSIIFHSH